MDRCDDNGREGQAEAQQRVAPWSPKPTADSSRWEGTDDIAFAAGAANAAGVVEDGEYKFLFPWALYRLLEESEANETTDVVSWQLDGKSFKVHKRDVFMGEILPRYFRQTRYKSFVRQLNLWGFSCIGSGSNKGAYSHHCFIRGDKDRCLEMRRTKIKGTGAPRKKRADLRRASAPELSRTPLQRMLQSPSGAAANALFPMQHPIQESSGLEQPLLTFQSASPDGAEDNAVGAQQDAKGGSCHAKDPAIPKEIFLLPRLAGDESLTPGVAAGAAGAAHMHHRASISAPYGMPPPCVTPNHAAAQIASIFGAPAFALPFLAQSAAPTTTTFARSSGPVSDVNCQSVARDGDADVKIPPWTPSRQQQIALPDQEELYRAYAASLSLETAPPATDPNTTTSAGALRSDVAVPDGPQMLMQAQAQADVAYPTWLGRQTSSASTADAVVAQDDTSARAMTVQQGRSANAACNLAASNSVATGSANSARQHQHAHHQPNDWVDKLEEAFGLPNFLSTSMMNNSSSHDDSEPLGVMVQRNGSFHFRFDDDNDDGGGGETPDMDFDYEGMFQ